MTVVSTAVLPRRRELPYKEVGAEILVRDPAAGQVHFLNPTAAFVWQACDGATPVAACEERLRARCEVPAGIDLAADIRAIAADFVRLGLADA